MGTKRIIGLNATTDFENDDNIVVDSTTVGTRKMAQSVLKEKLREDCLGNIHNLSTEASSANLDADDYAVVDSSANGTRKTKLSALSDWIHGRWASFVNALTAKTSFASGDKIAVVNGSTATAMGKDDLLKETAQNALAVNTAPAFDPTRTSANPYHENDPVVKDGVLYITKIEHYGVWEATHFRVVPSWDANFRSMYKSEFQGSSDDSTIFVVRSNDLDIGWIVSGKNYNHGSRCRTKMFIPINKGDRIVGVPQKKNIVASYSFYDSDKNFISNVDNLNNFSNGGSHDVISPVDGFIRLAFYNNIDTSVLSNTDYFDGCCVILRSGEAPYSDVSTLTKLGSLDVEADVTYSASMLELGLYDSTTGVKTGHSSRMRSIAPVKVRQGDEIYSTDTTLSIWATLLGSDGSVLDSMSSWGRAYKVKTDGYIVFHATTSQTFGINAFANKVKIERTNSELVFVSDRSDLVKGYYDAGGVLNGHNNRIANFREIWANKGDELVCNDYDLICNVLEQSISTGTILATHSWFSSRYVNPGDTATCKNVVVQNDNVRLLFTFAPAYGSPNVDIETQQHCIKIIRKSRDDYKSLFKKNVLPVGSKKGHPLTQYIYTGQCGCFVGDKLWVSFDAAGDTHYVNVVNVENDSVERTMTSELGHDGVQDYCEEKDTIVTVLNNGSSSKIRLIPNASQLTTEIAVADCIDIDINFSPGVVCFGENPQILYLSQMYDDSTQTRVDKVRKVFLAVDGNGDYTGVATIVKEYNIVVDWSRLCDFGRNNIMAVQDSAYDGYLYLALGTSGHNYMVLEKNDDLNVFVAVGRYAYDYYASDGTKKYLEPELLALKGDRIYCGSRHYNEQLASLVWLQR